MKKALLLLCLTIGFYSLANAQHEVKDSTFKEYTGKYSFPSGSVVAEITVTLGEDGVLVSSSTAGVAELAQKEKDLFDVPKFQGTAKFNRDSNGKVVGVSIVAMGYSLEGTKTTDGIISLYTKNLVAGQRPVAFSIR